MNTEQKQSINLSAYADTVLKEDRKLFAPQQSFSGFLNTVIAHYCDYADASIHAALARQQARLAQALEQDQILSERLTVSQQKRIIHLLDLHTEVSLLDKAGLYESGKTFTFRLNNRNCQHFFRSGQAQEDWPDREYYGGFFSRYLKAVVEEYCRLPLYQREEVVFRTEIEAIEDAINSGRMLRVEMQSPLTGHETWDVRPYAILPDAAHLYHYLVGRSGRVGGLRRDEKTASIRLSRIKSLSILSKKTGRSGMLAAAEKKEIRQKISTRSVSFLIGEEEEVVVRLTSEGRKSYENMLFLRPSLHHIDESGNYHFLCTRLQARQYFLRFGRDAEILQPEKLRNEFAEIFRNAASLYG